jgi:hypothetical protein
MVRQLQHEAPTRVTRVARVLAAIGVLAAVLLPATVGLPAGAQIGPSVTVAPTTDLADGQQVVVNVKTDAGNATPIYEARAYVCRTNVTYLSGDTDFPSVEGRTGGPNCPPLALSTSAQSIAISSKTYKFAPTAEGENLYLRVGVGVVEWTDTTSGSTARLACDQDNPCVLLVQLLTDAGFQPFVFDLTFRSTDAVGSCGGAAPGALASGGSDALADAWIQWTLSTCRTEQSGAWSTLAFGEESQAVKRFAQGELDLAYTALGYNPDAGFVEGVETPRDSVAVPIGLGAATLAVGNGYQDADGRRIPFTSPSLTLDETTTLLAGGEFPFRDLAVPIGARNPELADNNLVLNTATGVKVGGPAEAGSTPWVLTRHFDTLRPDLWKVPDSPIFAERGQPRGIDISLPLASPSYANVITTLTGRPAVAKALASTSDFGGVWLFTDLTTADAYDIAPVAIENASGQFVLPTNDSMTAAVPTMLVTEAGMRVPDPNATAGYPMTYVVYALAPASPLTDAATGACRTESQVLLAKWLTYVTRDGQSELPDGLAPLTPELKADADAALQKVGQTAGAPCPVPSIPPADGAPPASASVAGVSDSSGGSSGASSAKGGAVTVSSASSDAVEQANAELSVSDTSQPGFFGGTLPSLLAALLALVAIGGLTAFAARQTGRRDLPPGPQVVLPPPPDPGPGP